MSCWLKSLMHVGVLKVFSFCDNKNKSVYIIFAYSQWGSIESKSNG